MVKLKIVPCRICGKLFQTPTCGVYCSDDCYYQATGRKHRRHSAARRDIEDRGLQQAAVQLQKAVWLESAPPWVRHPVPWTDVAPRKSAPTPQ